MSLIRDLLSRYFNWQARRRYSRISMSIGNDWSYSGVTGPEFWHRSFPVAASDYQSPVSIDSEGIIYDPKLSDLLFTGYQNYFDGEQISLRNNGCTVKLNVESQCSLSRSDLSSTYEAEYVCFHWGSHDGCGSEHQLNGTSYPMEIQIVHRNSKYTKAEMYDKLDGILTLAFWVELGEYDHDGLRNISESLDRVRYKGQETYITQFPLASLLPADTSRYYTYVGSLTTPPCNECVTWVVLYDSIKISPAQLSKFRRLMTTPQDANVQLPLIDNFRPPQELRRRRVSACLKLQENFVDPSNA